MSPARIALRSSHQQTIATSKRSSEQNSHKDEPDRKKKKKDFPLKDILRVANDFVTDTEETDGTEETQEDSISIHSVEDLQKQGSEEEISEHSEDEKTKEKTAKSRFSRSSKLVQKRKKVQQEFCSLRRDCLSEKETYCSSKKIQHKKAPEIIDGSSFLYRNILSPLTSSEQKIGCDTWQAEDEDLPLHLTGYTKHYYNNLMQISQMEKTSSHQSVLSLNDIQKTLQEKLEKDSGDQSIIEQKRMFPKHFKDELRLSGIDHYLPQDVSFFFEKVKAHRLHGQKMVFTPSLLLRQCLGQGERLTAKWLADKLQVPLLELTANFLLDDLNKGLLSSKIISLFNALEQDGNRRSRQSGSLSQVILCLTDVDLLLPNETTNSLIRSQCIDFYESLKQLLLLLPEKYPSVVVVLHTAQVVCDAFSLIPYCSVVISSEEVTLQRRKDVLRNICMEHDFIRNQLACGNDIVEDLSSDLLAFLFNVFSLEQMTFIWSDILRTFFHEKIIVRDKKEIIQAIESRVLAKSRQGIKEKMDDFYVRMLQPYHQKDIEKKKAPLFLPEKMITLLDTLKQQQQEHACFFEPSYRVLLHGKNSSTKANSVHWLASQLDASLFVVPLDPLNNNAAIYDRNNLKEMLDGLTLYSQYYQKPVVLFFDKIEHAFLRGDQHLGVDAISQMMTLLDGMKQATRHKLLFIGSVEHVAELPQAMVCCMNDAVFYPKVERHQLLESIKNYLESKELTFQGSWEDLQDLLVSDTFMPNVDLSESEMINITMKAIDKMFLSLSANPGSFAMILTPEHFKEAIADGMQAKRWDISTYHLESYRKVYPIHGHVAKLHNGPCEVDEFINLLQQPQEMLSSFNQSMSLWLMGPQGSGKTTALQKIAQQTSWPVLFMPKDFLKQQYAASNNHSVNFSQLFTQYAKDDLGKVIVYFDHVYELDEYYSYGENPLNDFNVWLLKFFEDLLDGLSELRSKQVAIVVETSSPHGLWKSLEQKALSVAYFKFLTKFQCFDIAWEQLEKMYAKQASFVANKATFKTLFKNSFLDYLPDLKESNPATYVSKFLDSFLLKMLTYAKKASVSQEAIWCDLSALKAILNSIPKPWLSLTTLAQASLFS